MDILKLIRFPNLVIIAIVQLVVVVIIQSSNSLAFESPLELWLPVLCIILMTILIAATGYIVNDIYDREIDSINKVDSLIVGKSMSLNQAWTLYFSFVVLALISGFIARFLTGFWHYLAIDVFCLIILFLYAIKLKGTPGLGNLLVSCLCAGSILLIAWPLFIDLKDTSIDHQLLIRHLLALLTFAFMLTLSRELAKDIEDIEGDRQGNAKTIPVVFGVFRSRILLSILLFLSNLVLILFMMSYFKQISQFEITLIPIAITIGLLLYIFYKSLYAGEKTEFSFLSLLLKVAIIAGLIGFIFLQL